MNTKHATLVQVGGDRLEVVSESANGVKTDAGTIPWNMVDGFWVFHKPTQRMLFIPA